MLHDERYDPCLSLMVSLAVWCGVNIEGTIQGARILQDHFGVENSLDHNLRVIQRFSIKSKVDVYLLSVHPTPTWSHFQAVEGERTQESIYLCQRQPNHFLCNRVAAGTAWHWAGTLAPGVDSVLAGNTVPNSLQATRGFDQTKLPEECSGIHGWPEP